MEAAQTRKAHRQAATCHRLAARLAASQPPVTESLSEWAILLSECHWGGDAYVASGDDPTIFCPGSECTDNDGDGFAIEGGSCGTVDCDDNNADINPDAAEICDDIVDNDCDNNSDCEDKECTNALVCQTGSEPEMCDDGIDNDGDNKVDCADKKDCRTDPACTRRGSGGDPEICNDGIDNDGDRKIDCADKKDCRKNPVCQ